jgi:predicted dehydrogenase
MVRIGVIGGGSWGRNHLRVLSAAQCELIGLADLDEQKEPLAKQYDIRFETDFRKLLPLVDAVVVASPASTHFAIALECLKAGKHALVEKPFTLSLIQARELVEVAARGNLVLAVGHLYRMNPAVIGLREELKRIGHVKHACLTYLNMNRISPVDCSIIFDLGSHLFDLLLFLSERTPRKITFNILNNTKSAKGDFTAILVDYGDFSINLEMSWDHPVKRRDAWFVGEYGSIYADFLEQTLTRYHGANTTEGIRLPVIQNEPLKAEIAHFIDCIERNKIPLNNGEQACRVIELCELATQAIKSQGEVVI